MTAPLIANLGPTELILIVLVIVLLFGASKLPELARGSGRALRIFKAETKGLMDDDEADATTTTTATQSQAQLELEAKQRDLAERQAQLDAEAEKLQRGDTA
ncbi:Sec-independent protein translocase subunit TatA [Nocardioides halotolerans]|uniref:Sec-independent protein translocase subunit TatA n=1 Tax=Nocardioides halotolerans TaxID=433660 RepID=UPI0004203760|nr:Sec-independent protein translocase subunit TatA [Nocardioides halotolerans]